MRMSIAKLRARHPDWSWISLRCGFGWMYVGERGGAKVTLDARSMLCGPSDDDSEVVWFVDDGKRAEQYHVWSMGTR